MRWRLILLACFLVGVMLSGILPGAIPTQAGEVEVALLMINGAEVLVSHDGAPSFAAVNHLLMTTPLQVQLPFVTR